MKITLLQHLSGADGSFSVGDSIEVDEQTALRYIKKGIGKLRHKKDQEALVERVEKANAEQLEREAEAKAILEKGHIEAELNGLYGDVVLKEAELNGVVLTDEQTVEMVEELKKRILPEGKGE